MKRMILLALLVLSSCSSCSKKTEEVKVTQDYSDFQMVDEDDNTVELTDEEEYLIRMKVSKRTFYL